MLVASTFVREVHREWTRPSDEEAFVYCTFQNNKRGWVSKESLHSTRPDLSMAAYTPHRSRDAGRRTKPTSNETRWFQLVPTADAPTLLVKEGVDVTSPYWHDWHAQFCEWEHRIGQLEVHYARLAAHVPSFPSSMVTRSASTDGEGVAHVPHRNDVDDGASFDLEAFVTQHSFSEVAYPVDGPRMVVDHLREDACVGPFHPNPTQSLVA